MRRSSSRKRKTIDIYHHADFDGAAAAGIFGNFVDWLDPKPHRLRLHPIDYDSLQAFSRKTFVRETAVLDFPYHPDATWWFDHHETAFKLVDFILPALTHRQMWDPNAKSCPSLLGWFFRSAYQEYHGHFVERYGEVTRYADIIDSALYESPEQAYDLDDPFIVTGHILDMQRGTELPRQFAKAVRAQAWDRFFQSEVFLSARRGLRRQLAQLSSGQKRAVNFKNGIVTVNLLGRSLQNQRYFGYYAYPQAEYSVNLSVRNGKYYLGVGRNPWKSGSPRNLGRLMRRVGGGGRRDVGAALFASKAELEDAKRTVLEELRRSLDHAAA